MKLLLTLLVALMGLVTINFAKDHHDECIERPIACQINRIPYGHCYEQPRRPEHCPSSGISAVKEKDSLKDKATAGDGSRVKCVAGINGEGTCGDDAPPHTACIAGQVICGAANDAGKDGGVFQCVNGRWKLIQDCTALETCVKSPVPHCAWV